MRNLMRSEMYKLFKAKYLYVCLLCMCGMFTLLFVMMQPIMMETLDGAADEMRILSTMDFISAAFGSGDMMIFFIALFVCLLVVNEFRTMTIKHMLSVSNRRAIYLSKLLGAYVAVIILTLVAVLISILLGTIQFRDMGDVIAHLPFLMQFIAMQIIAGCASASIYVMLSFMIRNIAVALPICMLLHAVLLAALNGLSGVSELFAKVMHYTPMYISTYYSTPEAFAAGNTLPVLISCVGVAAITTIAGMLSFEKVDL